MGSRFATGGIVESILALMLLEAVLLLVLRRFARRGLPPLEVLTTLGAGAALMFALRAALVGAQWPVLAVWLLVALVAHGGDVALRWRCYED